MKVHVRTTGVTRFGKRAEGLVELLAEAGTAALQPLGRKPVDLLLVGSMASDILGETGNLVARLSDLLGLEAVAGYRIESASASGAAAVHAGAVAVASGSYHRVLVVAGEKMTGRPTADVAATLARSLAPAEFQIGATMPALAAIVAQRYLLRHGLTEEVLDLVSVQARQAASRNPNAQFRSPVSVEEVRASRLISAPLRLLHCSAVSDGAAAVVLEHGAGPVEIAGLGQSVDQLSLVDRPDLTTFRATRVAAQRAFEAARFGARSVSFAEVHDAFAPFSFIDLEDLGLCDPGLAPGLYRTGATLPDGRIPVNVSGGLLGRGHPVGASGIVQIAEAARQFTGEAGAMQLPGRPAVGLAQSIGGLGSHNFVTLLQRGASDG
ncbi:MAG: thiolase family protein [Thermoplasmata archaeon]|nr:thiolase family protein [Thermoplasmata archaeon]MCI4358896.1 thiolase family protein [Thermoplasmata archaeon]